ncbi:hypothetical protein GGI10_005325, partial [Coemansia sp. RSA 2530]
MDRQEPDPLQHARPDTPTAGKPSKLVPEISVFPGEHDVLVRSASQDSMSSNIPSYMHTPAEPYEDHGTLSTLAGPRSLLATAVLNNQATGSGAQEASLDAAVTSLQSIIGGAVMEPGS